LGPVSLSGILLVSGGIVSLAFQGRRLALSSLPYAFGTGCFIGAYSLTDGLGARLAGNGVAYIVWMGILWGGAMPLIYVAVRDRRSLFRPRRETLTAAGGGLVSILGYGIIIQAMTSGPLGPVSALRETSVVFAAIFGRVFLHERLTAGRLGACAVITAGAICLG
jgi:drug/metabolite transporter (DMT)-like permease